MGSSAHFRLISMQSICCLCWMFWTVKQYLGAPTGSMDCLVLAVWPLKLRRSLLPQLISAGRSAEPTQSTRLASQRSRCRTVVIFVAISEAFQQLSVAQATELCTSSPAYVIWSFHSKTPEHPFILSRLAFVSIWDWILGMPGNYAS